MAPSEAAKLIGCHKRYIRNLISQKKIKAKQIKRGKMKVWDISIEEIREFNRLPVPSRGYPRGKPRN